MISFVPVLYAYWVLRTDQPTLPRPYRLPAYIPLSLYRTRVEDRRYATDRGVTSS